MINVVGKYVLRTQDGKIFRLFKEDSAGVHFVDLDPPHDVSIHAQWPTGYEFVELPPETRTQFDKIIFSCEIGLHYGN